MPLIDVQRRMYGMGAIRLGNKVPTGRTNQKGEMITRPNKLDTFRITSPHRDVIDLVAKRYGGTVSVWGGAKGPEFETITTVTELPILVPNQIIDPNYELWGNKFRARWCDGARERIRGGPCLCRRWGNHDHKWWNGTCQICKLPQSWEGDPHTHEYVSGQCVTCGCSRPCKPTIRVSVMLQGIPVGQFKVESHGINAAAELSAPEIVDMVSRTQVPLPAVLAMRFEQQLRLVIRDGKESVETREFYVPEIRFPWILPEMMFAESFQLERAARAQITAGDDAPVLQALTMRPAPTPEQGEETLTAEMVIQRAAKCTTLAALRELWEQARVAGLKDAEASRVLTARGNALSASKGPEVIDAEIVEEYDDSEQ